MSGEEYVPTLAEVWDFLVGFKEATEASILRLESTMAAGFRELKSDIQGVKADVEGVKADLKQVQADVLRLERRVVNLDDRLGNVERHNA